MIRDFTDGACGLDWKAVGWQKVVRQEGYVVYCAAIDVMAGQYHWVVDPTWGFISNQCAEVAIEICGPVAIGMVVGPLAQGLS